MSKFNFKKIYSYVFQLLLFCSLYLSYLSSNWISFFIISFATLFMYYVNFSVHKNRVDFPNKLEIFLLFLVYLNLLFEQSSFIENAIFWAKITFYMIFSVVIGIIGFMVIYVLNKEKKVLFNLDPEFIALFSLCFSISIGVFWQVFRFLFDYILGISIQNFNAYDALGFISVHSAGAIIVSLTGYFYLKSEDDKYFIKRILKVSVLKKGNQDKEIDDVVKMIKRGENEKVEFKSTLRTNLHTNEHDKRIELSSLKTIVAYLNSKGGTLLIGVDDKGVIQGIGKDNFKSNDKLSLHLINIIKQHIGAEFISYIDFKIVKLKGKEIIRVNVNECKNPVFLKADEEEFYIRSGPSSLRLRGSKMIAYVNRKFN